MSAKLVATSQTQTFMRLPSGARKASFVPSGEIAALLIFGLSSADPAKLTPRSRTPLTLQESEPLLQVNPTILL